MRFTFALLLFLISRAVSADTVFGVYLEGGVARSDFESDFYAGEPADTVSLSDDGVSSFFVTAKIETLFPGLPNFMFSYDAFGYSATTSEDAPWNGAGMAGAGTVKLRNITDFTGTLYYEVLDNFVSLDAGLSLKQMVSDVSLYSSDGAAVFTGKVRKTIPMIYILTELEIPSTPWFIGASGDVLKLGPDAMQMAQIYLGYQLKESLALDLAIKAGLRSRTLDLQNTDGFGFDSSDRGAFLSARLHF